MKHLLLLPLLYSLNPAAAEMTDIACDYKFMGVDMARVEVAVDENGRPDSSVQVTMQGRSHKETATPEVLAADEFLHLWISKENPENTIEMVIYKARRAEGRSKLVNHNVPIGKEVWGECSGVPDAE